MRGIDRLAIAAVVLLAGAGCSSNGTVGSGGSGDQGLTGGGALIESMQHLHVSGTSGEWISFSQPAQLAVLKSGSPAVDSAAFDDLRGRGLGLFVPTDHNSLASSLVGLNLDQPTHAIDVGSHPHEVGVFEGSFDPAAIGTKLAASGLVKKDLGGGQTEWTIPAGSAAHQQVQNAIGDDSLAVLRVSASKIAYGHDDADLDAALTATSPTLATDALDSALADCLGDPTAAEIDATTGSPAYAGIAVGVRVASASDITEEVCVAAADDATAQKYATTMTAAVKPGGRPSPDGWPWSQSLTSPTATVVGGPEHVARLTAKAADWSHAADLLSALSGGQLGVLIGQPASDSD